MIYKEDNRTEIKCHIDKRVCITSECSAWMQIPNLHNTYEDFLEDVKGKDLTPEQLDKLNEFSHEHLDKGYCGLVIQKRPEKLAIRKDDFNLKVYQMECENSIKKVKAAFAGDIKKIDK